MPKSELLNLIFERRPIDRQLVLAGANLHGLYMFETNASYRALLEQPATMVILDGMPMVWLLKMLGFQVARTHRTTWLDWFEDALKRAAAEKRRVYILGHSTAILDVGLAKARAQWPNLIVAGRDGFFDLTNPRACDSVIDHINAFAPDILFVGMGMPKQEVFVSQFASRLQAPVIGLGGAAFAYFAGEQLPPPRWMGQAGLEWAHRLYTNPRRMFIRYLLEPLMLPFLIVHRLVHQSRSSRSS